MTPLPLRLTDFDYQLPTELIAQTPAEPRDHSRLLVVHKNTEQLSHKHFYDIGDYLEPGDVLVVNTSKVIKARLRAHKLTGGAIEIFLLRPLHDTTWECLIGGKVRPKQLLIVGESTRAVPVQRTTDDTWEVQFDRANITDLGEMPLPPYIHNSTGTDERYQTVYAEQAGSVAAPTAGLHFTEALLSQLKAKGVIVVPVLLHVGLGTFASVKTDDITQHKMHAEYAVLPAATAQAISQAKANGHKVVAVGTTSCRTLEAFHGKAGEGWVNIYIYPGYTFNIIDALITNFHLPKTSLLMLVSALAGKTTIDHAYAIAIAERYRFYSFGDAMLII